MAGLPPFLGFLAKEEIYYALWATDPWSLAFVAVAVVGNGLMFAIGFRRRPQAVPRPRGQDPQTRP
jgi:multicomponent Na+:H+ antiporter subunit A